VPDIKQATDLVRKLVCDYGMTDDLGPLSYGEKDEQIFLGREIARHRDYSDKTADTIDGVMRRIIDEQHNRAKQILTEHRDEVERLANALLEHELLDAEEIKQVIRGDILASTKKTRSLTARAPRQEAGAQPNGPAPVPDPAQPETAAAAGTAGQGDGRPPTAA
jgi:cell division protease FtsH